MLLCRRSQFSDRDCIVDRQWLNVKEAANHTSALEPRNHLTRTRTPFGELRESLREVCRTNRCPTGESLFDRGGACLVLKVGEEARSVED